ncbi:MAG: AMP-binding protein [Myxococcota bacterium]
MSDTPATIVHALAAAAQEEPDRLALRFVATTGEDLLLSFGDLWRDARRVAGHLRAEGAIEGHAVVLLLPPGREFVASFFGVLLAGAVPTPLAPPFRQDALGAYLGALKPIFASCAPRVFFAPDETAAHLATLAPEARVLSAETALLSDALAGAFELPRPEATAVLQYTSGANSVPRGIRLSHRAVVANIDSIGRALGLGRDEVALSWLPMFADMGLIGVLLTGIYWRFAQVHLRPEAFLIKPARWLQAISRFGATVSCAPNFAYKLTTRRVLDRELEGVDLSAWRIALVGAERVEPDAMAAFAERFEPHGLRRGAVVPTYGLAENTLAATIGVPGEPLAARALDGEGGPLVASAGRPMAGQEVRIFDAHDVPLEDGRVGEIVVRSGSLMDGYEGCPDATASKLRGGWLRTGDLGALISGELFVTGRSKPMIIKRGRNYYPDDIERLASSVLGLPAGAVLAYARDNDATGTEDVVLVAESAATDDEEARGAATRALNAELLQSLGIRADEVIWLPPGETVSARSRPCAP